MAFVWQLLSFGVYLVGLLAIAAFFFDNFKSVVSIIKAILEPYFQPQLPQTLVEKFGKWAVITGSTDGIGREYAKELAKQGINVVLISRTKEKLIAVAEEIENEYKVKTKWIVADFAKGREVYAHIERELSGIPVGILVNNVGKMYDYPDELSNISEDTIWDMININVAAVTIMTRMLIPELKKQKRGAIVNLSSGSELQPMPNMAVYVATKRYVRCFSQAIERELAEHNITVQIVTPLFVVTKMNQYSDTVMKGGFLRPDVKSYTRFAVFTLGKSAETTGYWQHGLQYFFMKLSPEWLRIRIAHVMTRHFRREYLKNHGKKV
ncbi:inactive hydroxysteroid dehydrogenase-like protein 1 isoform X2 [Bactrocera dorsalis]|nr:inactive hydroxysteroid dehydrogenase-like protein 1 isoform X2 [Bactrocera dorsalis]XP_049304509.1 inactive hydroxysteroid dehydrogenase-like protein 1 isoform X2 [Bactrocera dorsalis]XP_049304513.1 inactive hydroxysteroid dehydrogenase-like protein 1 isoform X2 [Bactrocera dorsalis]